MRIQKPSSTRSWLAILAMAAVLPACGGGGGGSNNPTPVTQPPAPTRTLLFQGNFNLASVAQANNAGLPFDTLLQEFTLGSAGTLEVNADWTFPSSAMGIGVLRGPCSFNQFYADTCVDVAFQFPAAKPGRMTITNLAAGTYVFAIANPNPTTESGNYQVYITR